MLLVGSIFRHRGRRFMRGRLKLGSFRSGRVGSGEAVTKVKVGVPTSVIGGVKLRLWGVESDCKGKLHV